MGRYADRVDWSIPQVRWLHGKEANGFTINFSKARYYLDDNGHYVRNLHDRR